MKRKPKVRRMWTVSDEAGNIRYLFRRRKDARKYAAPRSWLTVKRVRITMED